MPTNTTFTGAVTETVLNQRVRNRIIECLESVTSEERCAALGPDELVNLWYDFVPEWSPEAYPFPTYTDAEREGIRQVHDAFDCLVRSTPNPMPSLALLKRESAWVSLVGIAKAALDVFEQRGRLDEHG